MADVRVAQLPLPLPPFLSACSYAGSLGEAAAHALANVRVTHLDPVVTGQSMSFALLVAAMIQVCNWWQMLLRAACPAALLVPPRCGTAGCA